VERVGVVPFGLSHNRELEVGDQRVVPRQERAIDDDAFADTRIREVLANAHAIGGVGEPPSKGRQVVLRSRVLNVREQLAAFAHEVQPTADEIPRRPHGCGIGVGLWQQAAAQEADDLEGVDFVVLRFTAMDRPHRERMAEDEADALRPR
jgi:hypothetical protein